MLPERLGRDAVIQYQVLCAALTLGSGAGFTADDVARFCGVALADVNSVLAGESQLLMKADYGYRVRPEMVTNLRQRLEDMYVLLPVPAFSSLQKAQLPVSLHMLENYAQIISGTKSFSTPDQRANLRRLACVIAQTAAADTQLYIKQLNATLAALMQQVEEVGS